MFSRTTTASSIRMPMTRDRAIRRHHVDGEAGHPHEEKQIAQTKHACPACGAQAEWNPAKQKLVCPFCGTESPYQIDREVG